MTGIKTFHGNVPTSFRRWWLENVYPARVAVLRGDTKGGCILDQPADADTAELRRLRRFGPTWSAMTDEALQLLLAGRSAPATVSQLTQTQGIGRRQAQRYVAAAYEIIRGDIEQSKIDRRQQLAKLAHMLEEGAAVALATRNVGALVGACRELRELLQLNPPKPHGY